MNTVMIPNSFPAAIPSFAQNGGGWRPAAHAQLRAYPVTRAGETHWRPSPVQLGQARIAPGASIAKGADVLFSMLTAVGAMTVGIAAMTVGIGGDKTAVPAKPASKTWKVIGGITASFGALMLLLNVAKISAASEMTVQTTTPTSQPQS